MTNINKKESNNFIQVGQTIECGRCCPEKFEDCVSLQAKYGHKCNCICHQSPNNSVESWEEEFYLLSIKFINEIKEVNGFQNYPMSIFKDYISQLLKSSRSQVVES